MNAWLIDTWNPAEEPDVGSAIAAGVRAGEISCDFLPPERRFLLHNPACCIMLVTMNAPDTETKTTCDGPCLSCGETEPGCRIRENGEWLCDDCEACLEPEPDRMPCGCHYTADDFYWSEL